MSTTAILFDLDNTLVPEMASYESAFASATESTVRRLELEPAALRDAVFGAAAKLWLASPVSAYCLRVGIGSPTSLVSDFPGTGDELAYLREWASAYRRESWVSGLEQLGVRDSVNVAAELDRAFRENLANHVVPYADALPALERLGSSYVLALATNGPADVQTTKLRASGLERFFPLVVASSEIGFGKPDPRIFRAALERMKLPAAEVLVVGDSLEKDVAGSAAAGLRCVWVNRTRAKRTSGPAPAFEIESLAELHHILE